MGIESAVSAMVDEGGIAGAATLVWRQGRVVRTAAVGWRNVDARW